MQPRDREDVNTEKLAPLRVMQIRLPVTSTAKIIEQTQDVNCPGSVDYQKLSTNSRFYLLTGSDGKLKLVDQVRFFLADSKPNHMQTPCLHNRQMCLVAAFRTVAPTMNLQCAYAISLNILVRYGVNADVNGDGEISPDEWTALDKILKDQDSAGGDRNKHKSRLISLML